VLPAHAPFRRLVEATAGKIAAAGAMLAAAAVVVLASGGAGVFGPLGSVISGHGSRSATETVAGTEAAGADAIVAAPNGSTAGLVDAGGRPGAPGGRRGGAGGRQTPGGGRAPAGGLPGIPVSQGGGGSGGGGPGTPAPPKPNPPPAQGGQALDAAGNTVEQIGRQAPALQPVTDPVGRLTHQVAETCRRLVVCP
jgi:hypothetical protein